MWQSIETAPKDGVWILVYGGNAQDGDETIWGTWYRDPIKQMKQEAALAAINARPVVARWHEAHYGGWTYAAWDSDWRSIYSSPTHWMPLPEPPTNGE